MFVLWFVSESLDKGSGVVKQGKKWMIESIYHIIIQTLVLITLGQTCALPNSYRRQIDYIKKNIYI